MKRKNKVRILLYRWEVKDNVKDKIKSKNYQGEVLIVEKYSHVNNLVKIIYKAKNMIGKENRRIKKVKP